NLARRHEPGRPVHDRALEGAAPIRARRRAVRSALGAGDGHDHRRCHRTRSRRARPGDRGRTLGLMTSTRSLTELADGVYAWLQPGGESGVSNAGVVVEDDGITVIDTLMVRSQWVPFAAAVNELGLPVRRAILTHAHIDHCGGTKAFDRAAVYGSQQTSDVLD